VIHRCLSVTAVPGGRPSATGVWSSGFGPIP